MKRCITFTIEWRVVCRFGVKGAAVLGWLYKQCCLMAHSRDPAKKCAYWVRVSEAELAGQLHLCRQTVAKILHQLEAASVILVKDDNADKRDRTRSYTLCLEAFLLMNERFRQWSSWRKEAMLFWGATDTVASQLGVNAAIVFQYLWYWCTCNHYTSRLKKGDRVWLSYTPASLARWLPFMSEDVIRCALRRLEKAALILCRCNGRTSHLAIGDEGFRAMGQAAPCTSSPTPSAQKAAHPPRKKVSPLPLLGAIYSERTQGGKHRLQSSLSPRPHAPPSL